MIQIGDVFATVITEEDKYDADVTEHPAEKGSDFSDMVINKALVVTRDCVISATPLGVNRNAAFGPNIVAGCKARLIAMRALREPITVVDIEGTFTNLLVSNLTFTKSIKTGEALAFKITFKQLEVIENERSVIEVAIPRAQAPRKKGAKSSESPGAHETDDIDPLRKAANYIGKKINGKNFISDQPNPGGGIQ